jgi:hypothetical protein
VVRTGGMVTVDIVSLFLSLSLSLSLCVSVFLSKDKSRVDGGEKLELKRGRGSVHFFSFEEEVCTLDSPNKYAATTKQNPTRFFNFREDLYFQT